LKYKVEIKKKGYRNPKMTRHAKNTSCLDIKKYIKGIFTRRSKEIKIKPENKHQVLIIKID
jgi:hypothetical protein